MPHSEISGSKLILSSPELIAEYHVLHRLLLPRHSPNALLALDLIQKKTNSIMPYRLSATAGRSQSRRRAGSTGAILLNQKHTIPLDPKVELLVSVLDLDNIASFQPGYAQRTEETVRRTPSTRGWNQLRSGCHFSRSKQVD